MKYHNLSIAGNYTRRSLELSLVLDDASLDSEKPYRANRETARAIWHHSGWHLRMRTRRGGIAIQQQSENVLSGRFRLDCACEEFNVLLGWQRRAPILVQGQFTALMNSAEGWEILESTEVDNARRRDAGGVTFSPGG